MIASLRRWMYRKALENHPNFNARIDKSAENPCHNVAIFGDGTKEENRVLIEKYASTLRSTKKSVDILYYIDTKNDIDEGYSKKNIKWNNIPMSDSIEEFIRKEYDILICLLPLIEMHHSFIVNLIKAPLKVGIQQMSEYSLFDLMIDPREKDNLSSFIDQINSNLDMISYK